MCFTVEYEENTTNMASALDCSAVLDLSTKSTSLSPMKTDPQRVTPTFDSKFPKDSVHPTENRSYESSALINTPPHESELSGPKNTQNLFNVGAQFCPNMEISMMGYPRIIADPQKNVHMENQLNHLNHMPPLFQHFPSIGTNEPPTITPYNFTLSQPLVSMAVPTEIPVSPISQLNNQTNHQTKPHPKKINRPFKVYPNVPSFGNDDIDHIMKELSQERYEEYRDRVLKNVESSNIKGTNVKMRRESKSCTPTSTMHDKNEAYLEKRKKNNAAAKRSRDARKRKEDEIAIRAAYLENKVALLTQLLKKMQNENNNLRHYRDIVLQLNHNAANVS